MPVIGFLHDSWPEPRANLLAAFRQGLSEAGFVDGRNVMVEYRWAQDQLDRLPGLAADLVRRQVTVIVAVGGVGPALAAKAATDAIPIDMYARARVMGFYIILRARRLNW
jgi:putative ABC transport system substrate-binding protein